MGLGALVSCAGVVIRWVSVVDCTVSLDDRWRCSHGFKPVGISQIDTTVWSDMLERMWFPFNGWAARAQILVTRLQFGAGQAKDEDAAATMARELDAAAFATRIDRARARAQEPSGDGSSAAERSAPDG